MSKKKIRALLIGVLSLLVVAGLVLVILGLLKDKEPEPTDDLPIPEVPVVTPVPGVRTVYTYIDESFDDLSIGDSLEAETNIFELYEGGGFVASSKDEDGNVWIQAKDIEDGTKWGLAYTNVYRNGMRYNLKDFCVSFGTRIPSNGQPVPLTADGGACILRSPSGPRYDLAINWNAPSNGTKNNSINLWLATMTDDGPYATTQHTWGDRGSVVSDFTMTPNITYNITICGKYQGMSEDGSEYFTLYVFVDDTLVVYQRDIPYWAGGFGIRGGSSCFEYSNFKVTDFPLVCPDGIDHYSVDNETTTYSQESFDKLATPILTLGKNKISWAPVEGAGGYNIYHKGNLLAFVEEPCFDFSDFYVDKAALEIEATPNKFSSKASGRATVVMSHPATLLETPVIEIKDNIVSWNKVDDANYYAIYVNDVLVTEQTGVVFRPELVDELKTPGEYSITVKSISTHPGFISSGVSNDVIFTVEKGLNLSDVKYLNGVVTWVGDHRATGYELVINGADPITVTETTYTLDASTAYAITIKAVDSTGTNKESISQTVYSGETTVLKAPHVTYLDGSMVWEAVSGATGYRIWQNGKYLTTIDENSYTYPIAAVYNVQAISEDVLVLDSSLSNDFVTMGEPEVSQNILNNVQYQSIGSMADLGWNNTCAKYTVLAEEEGIKFFGTTDPSVFHETWFWATDSTGGYYKNWTWTTYVKPISSTGDNTFQLLFGTSSTDGRYTAMFNVATNEIQICRGDVLGTTANVNMGSTMKLGNEVTLEYGKISKITISQAMVGQGGIVTIFVDDICVLQASIPNVAKGDYGLWLNAGMDAWFGNITVSSLANGADGTYTGAPITLSAPHVRRAGDVLTWSGNAGYVYGYEVYLDGSLVAKLPVSPIMSYTILEDGEYLVKAVGNSKSVLSSEFTSVCDEVYFSSTELTSDQKIGDIANIGDNEKYIIVEKGNVTSISTSDSTGKRGFTFETTDENNEPLVNWYWSTQVKFTENNNSSYLELSYATGKYKILVNASVGGGTIEVNRGNKMLGNSWDTNNGATGKLGTFGSNEVGITVDKLVTISVMQIDNGDHTSTLNIYVDETLVLSTIIKEVPKGTFGITMEGGTNAILGEITVCQP